MGGGWRTVWGGVNDLSPWDGLVNSLELHCRKQKSKEILMRIIIKETKYMERPDATSAGVMPGRPSFFAGNKHKS